MLQVEFRASAHRSGGNDHNTHRWREARVKDARRAIQGFPDSQLAKTPPAVQETLLRFLGWEKIRQQCRTLGFNPWVGKTPWRRERLPNSSILAWRIPWTVYSWGRKELDTIEWLSQFLEYCPLSLITTLFSHLCLLLLSVYLVDSFPIYLLF